MIKVLFTSKEDFLMFLYPLSLKYPVTYHEVYEEYNLVDCYTFDDFLFCFDYTPTHRAVEVFDVLVEFYGRAWGLDIPNSSIFDDFVRSGKKVIVMDNQTDPLPSTNSTYFERMMNDCDNLYFINARTYYKNTDKSIQGLHYLNLFYGFFFYKDKLHLHPKLPKLKVVDQPYDFITYIGLEQTKKSKGERRQIIERILNETQRTVYICESFRTDRKQIQKKTNGKTNLGNYCYFSHIESLQAKVKLRFETLPSTGVLLENINFFTEKTVGCFVSNQPYFLFIRESQRKYLKSLGFKLVGPSNSEDYINYVIDICNSDLDGWIEENQHTFDHNKELFYDMIYDYTLPHITFLEDITKR